MTISKKRKMTEKIKEDIDLEDILCRRELLNPDAIKANLIDNERIKQAGKILLGILLFASMAGVAVLAPNLFSAFNFKKQGLGKFRSQDVRKIKAAFYQLKRRDLVEMRRDRKNLPGPHLTEKGKKAAMKLLFDNFRIQPDGKWDGVWRVVIFDIPTQKNRQRDILRQRLDQVGFFQLQKSVFVSPFSCKNELDIICEVYDLWDYVNYFEAVNIDNEGNLRSYFEL